MSNSLAIAAVTTTLRSLLERALGIEVTTKPLDQARRTTTDQLNLFLYQMAHNAGLSNMPMRPSVKPGETGQPPLALKLYYLVTAYGQNDNDALAHQLLGQAMLLLHDHPLLDPGEIRDATLTELPDSDLHTQVERVRITPQPVALEEMSKLWTTFQTQFRISAAYEVSVVLIESARPAKTPLPVLARGSDTDSGVASQPNLLSPVPTINTIELPGPEFSALLNDTLTIKGLNLDNAVAVRFMHTRAEIERVVTTLITHTATEVSFTIPDEPADLPAGFYTLAVDVIRPGETFTRTTNRLAFALAPEITSPLPMTVTRDDQGLATVTLDCRPDALPEQRVALLLGDREILAQPHSTQTSTVSFQFNNPTPDDAPDAVEHLVRLRVDGVDSLLIDRTGTVPVFRDNQKVRIE
ncbi:MAG: Pvc16 family protein [Pyrinomonadaceae bacterium]